MPDAAQHEFDATKLLQDSPQPLVYLASPYTHKDPVVRARRFRAACEYAAELLNNGTCVFSPIAHSHPIAEHGTEDTFDFWMKWDVPYLHVASALVVMTLDGWKESRGVQAEIEIMKRLGKPIIYSHHGSQG